MTSLYQRGSPRGQAGSGRKDVGRRKVGPTLLSVNLPPVDMELLRSRLVSTAGPSNVPRNPNALVFTRSTKTQDRRAAAQKPVQLEILPALKRYQDRNQPEFIHRQNRERLISAGWKPPSHSSARIERTDPFLERRPSTLQLPHIPDHLKERQVQSTHSMLSSVSPAKSPRSSSKPHIPTMSPISYTPSPPLTKPLFFSSVEEVIRARIRSPSEIAQVIRNNPDLGFLYMTSAEPKSSIKYDAYKLKIVTYENINKSDYYTISGHGVMHCCEDQVDFLPLECWEQEYRYHRRLLQIPVFTLFRKWKAFRVWRTNVRSKAINKCKRSLQDRLFIINESLRPALIDIREMCYRISDMGLCRMEKERTYTLQEFQTAQYSQLQEVTSRLEEFRELVKEVAGTACRTAMLEAGYTPDYGTVETDGSESKLHADLELLYKETSQKMSYTEQAKKRYHCSRLTCFIRLADYLILNTMHVLAVNSISKLLSVLQEQNTHTPSHSLIQSWVSSETGQQTQTKEKIAEIISRFQKTVLSLEPLVPDSYFDAFTRPIINNKVEEKTCGDGPSLEATLEDDQHLQDIIHNIKVTIFQYQTSSVQCCTY